MALKSSSLTARGPSTFFSIRAAENYTVYLQISNKNNLAVKAIVIWYI